MQAPPLLLRKRGFGAALATHPRVNFIFNSVEIRWAKKKLGLARARVHKIDNLLSACSGSRHFRALIAQTLDELVQIGSARRRDFNARQARIDALLADLEFHDVERCSTRHD